MVVDALKINPDTGMNFGVPHFANNFHLLFLGLAKGRQSKDDFYIYTLRNSSGYSEELEQTEAFRAALAFMENDDWKKLREFFSAYIAALRKREFDELEVLETSRGGTSAVTQAEAYVWRQLNPLLEQVAEELRAAGIDPEQLYG